MVGGPGLRFALEAAFLVVLAIAAGLAELSPTTIVLVMAAAWVLVAVIEWLAWKETAPLTRVVREEPAPAEAVPPEARHGWRFWRRREAEPVEPEPVAPSTMTPATPPTAPPAPVQPRSDDTQDLGPSPDPPAAMRADERTGT